MASKTATKTVEKKPAVVKKTAAPKKDVVAKATTVKKSAKSTSDNVGKQPKATEVLKAEQTVAKPTRKAAIKVDVYGTDGKVAETLSLPGDIFGAKVNPELMAQAVRVYLANQRTGTASTKTRGEVRGSTRKIYRQKGTGRARHGGVRAPIFVKGGVAHGPKPRDYSLSFSKKMRKASLFSALTTKLQGNEIKIVSGLEKVTPKTKEMAKVLQNLSALNKNQKVLMVVGKNEKHDTITRSVRNIDGITYAFPEQLNTYEVLNSKMILFMKDAVDAVEKHFMKKGTSNE